MHILIVGGGWAGIAAAFDAANRGDVVTLIEERPYIGGRARSFTDRTMLDEIDNGQHVMMGCYNGTLSILRALGTEELLERQKALRVAFVEPGGRCDVLDASALPGRLGIALGMWRLRGIRWVSRLAGLRLALGIAAGRVTGKGRSCRELLERHGQPPDIIERFWEPIVLATLNASLRDASAELLVAVMRLAFLGSRTDAQLLIPTAGLSALIEPFPAWVEARGGQVQTSTSVDRMTVDPTSGRVRVTLSSGDTVDVDRVISAVPQRALDRLLRASGIDHEFPDPPHMSPIVSVYLWYSVRWMPQDFTAALGTTVQWVFDKRRIRPGLVALTVSAGADLVGRSSDEIVQTCDAELRSLFPAELSGVELVHGVVIKEKQATPLLTPTAVLDRAETRSVPQAPWLAVAGDWTQTGLPATIEGAVRSGFSASSAVRA